MSGDFRVGQLRKRFEGEDAGESITVGRAPTSDIPLQDIEVSKVHSVFKKTEGVQWEVRDNYSTNGTYLNDRLIPVATWTTLSSMDTLQFSRGVNAVFFYPGDFYHFLRSPEVRTILDES